jgi:hypothetical protein
VRTGRTYTAHFAIETRQHDLMGLDLGEGVPRKPLVLGLILFALWNTLLVLVAGLPSRTSSVFYMVPPLVVAAYGTQPCGTRERRWNITVWALRLRYLLIGHRPVICGGRRTAARSERISRRARWESAADLLDESPLASLTARWLGARGAPLAGTGSPLDLNACPRLYGPDAVARAHGHKN